MNVFASIPGQRRRADGVGTGRPWLPVSAARGAAELEEEHRPAGRTPVIGSSSTAAPGVLEEERQLD